jgi:hypothetical protein
LLDFDGDSKTNEEAIHASRSGDFQSPTQFKMVRQLPDKPPLLDASTASQAITAARSSLSCRHG